MSVSNEMDICFRLKEVDLVYGSKPKQAFEAIDAGLTRHDIQTRLGVVVGVHHVSLEVYHGEILVLMGLSGSGKSSLLRCFNGLNGRGVGKLRGLMEFCPHRTEKSIRINQCSEREIRELRRHHIAMVFQQFALMPWRSVWQNVAYPLELQGLPKAEIEERVDEKLALVQLHQWRDAMPFELSGGMQQRVGIARALVTDAPVLLLDEPFSALDPLHRRALQDELLELQDSLKKTMIFVTHDFDEAAHVGDRIGILESGQLLQLGSLDQILSQPSCSSIEQFTHHYRVRGSESVSSSVYLQV